MTRLLLIVALALGPACGTDPPCPAAALDVLEATPAWAVVTSDFTSTAIALLDDEGALVEEAWVDSGSAEPGIVAALSGDVALPSRPLATGELTLIDRFGVDIVSRFDLTRGTVIAQLDTQLDASAGGGGFRANPQDVLLDGGSLLVSRFQPNLDPGAPELDRGNDLVWVDEGGPRARIAFDALDTDVDGVRIYARPGRMARLGDSLLVGLGRLDADFAISGPGAVAVVSGEPPTVSAIALDGLSNCPELRGNPTGDAVIVLCAGDTFALAEDRRAGAGVARIVEGRSGPSVSEIWRAVDHPAAPVPTGTPVPLGGARVAVPALGEAAGGDQIAVVDLVSEEIAVGYVAEDAFVIGAGGYDPATRLLLVPDANVGILRFHVDELALTPLAPIDVSPCRGLPAREVGALSP